MVYKWYILPIGGLYATYHLFGEPETTIESTKISKFLFKCHGAWCFSVVPLRQTLVLLSTVALVEAAGWIARDGSRVVNTVDG